MSTSRLVTQGRLRSLIRTAPVHHLKLVLFISLPMSAKKLFDDDTSRNLVFSADDVDMFLEFEQDM